jgi:hypothetical protein
MLTFLKVEDCGPAESEDLSDIYQDSMLEGLKYLIERSDDQERQLAQLSTDWQLLFDRSQEQWAKFSSECNKVGTQRDRQIEDLYSNSVRLAEAIHQQSEHIKHLELNRLADAEHIKYLEARLNQLAESLVSVARKRQSTTAKSTLTYWSRRLARRKSSCDLPAVSAA